MDQKNPLYLGYLMRKLTSQKRDFNKAGYFDDRKHHTCKLPYFIPMVCVLSIHFEKIDQSTFAFLCGF
jgi:hypothetical protein